MAKRMVKIRLNEISGVQNPANLTPGWAVMKGYGMDAEAIAKALTDNETLRNEVAEMMKEFEEPSVPEGLDGDALDAFKKAQDEAREAIRKAQEEAEQARKMAESERNARLDSEAVRKARGEFDGLSVDVEKFAPALRKMSDFDSEAADEVVRALKSAAAIASESEMFKEVGNGGEPSGSTPQDRLESLAQKFVESGEVTDMHAAMAKALESEEGRRLYAESRKVS